MADFIPWIIVAIMAVFIYVRERRLDTIRRRSLSEGAEQAAPDQTNVETVHSRAAIRPLDAVAVENGLKGLEINSPLRVGFGGPHPDTEEFDMIYELDRRLAEIERHFAYKEPALHRLVFPDETPLGPFLSICCGCGEPFASPTTSYRCKACTLTQLKESDHDVEEKAEVTP